MEEMSLIPLKHSPRRSCTSFFQLSNRINYYNLNNFDNKICFLHPFKVVKTKEELLTCSLKVILNELNMNIIYQLFFLLIFFWPQSSSNHPKVSITLHLSPSSLPPALLCALCLLNLNYISISFISFLLLLKCSFRITGITGRYGFYVTALEWLA